jgi:hypothetical protein
MVMETPLWHHPGIVVPLKLPPYMPIADTGVNAQLSAVSRRAKGRPGVAMRAFGLEPETAKAPSCELGAFWTTRESVVHLR